MDENEIKFDDLITETEFFALAEAVRRDGNIDEAEVERLVNWAMEKRNGVLCVEMLIAGLLTVQCWKDGNPVLLPSEEAINNTILKSVNNLPMLEETRC